MPAHFNETQQQRYQRERDDYLKALAKYTPEQIAAVEVDLNNATATIAQLRAVLRGLVDDIQGLIAESDGVAGLHRNGDVAPWGELEAGGQFERLSHLPAAIEAAQCSEVGRKCSEQCAELPAPPVPRDVLMAFGAAIQKDCLAQLVKAISMEHAQLLVEGVDLAAIADRYASKVHPERNTVTLEEMVEQLKAGENGDAISEAMTQATDDMALGRAIREGRAKQTDTVNQQLLARWLAFGKAMQKSGSELPRHLIAETEAAEAAHTVGMPQTVSVTDERSAFEAWLQERIDATDTVRPRDDKVEAYFATLLARAQQPSSVQPVAVPDGARHWAYRRYGSEPQKGYTIVSRAAGATHGGTPVAYLGDGELAGDAVQAICEAHNAALAAVAVPDEIDPDKAPWAPAEMEPDIAYADGWNACRAAMLSAAQKQEGV